MKALLPIFATSAFVFAGCIDFEPSRRPNTPETAREEVEDYASRSFGVRAAFVGSEDCEVLNQPVPELGWQIPHLYSLSVTDPGNSALEIGAPFTVALIDEFPAEPSDQDLIVFFQPHDPPLETSCGNDSQAYFFGYGTSSPVKGSLGLTMDDAMATLRETPDALPIETAGLERYENVPPDSGTGDPSP